MIAFTARNKLIGRMPLDLDLSRFTFLGRQLLDCLLDDLRLEAEHDQILELQDAVSQATVELLHILFPE